jgi:hypothetical protein
VKRFSSSPEERGAKPAALDDGAEQWHNLKTVPGNSSRITVDGRTRGAFQLCPEARPILRALAIPCWRSRRRFVYEFSEHAEHVEEALARRPCWCRWAFPGSGAARRFSAADRRQSP